MKNNYKNVKIGELAVHTKNWIVIDDETEYIRCRVQLHRKGIVLRDKIRGSEIRTKKQQQCKSGQFIVAEMDAKFGG